MTKVDLITGILGSGKTTFLRKYAGYFLSHNKRIAILENDFGAVNIDMMMLRDLRSEKCQIEMIVGGGDPCCHKRRFKTQLISLGMQHFDRIIIEPSGIFDMDELFDVLHESPLDRWLEIGSIITIADAETEEKLSPQMEYLLGSEAACCGKLILSKRNSFPHESDEHITQRILDHINSSLKNIRCDRQLTAGDMVIKDWKSFTDEDMSGFAGAGYRGSSYVKLYSPEDIKSSVHYYMHIRIPEGEIPKLVDRIMKDRECGKVFRIKGSVPTDEGKWIKINAVSDKTELSYVPEGQAVIIVIGDELDQHRISSYISENNTDNEYVYV